MAIRRVAMFREAATLTLPGLEKFAVQAARRIVRLQERRRKLKRELKAINDEIRIAKGQLRAVTRATPSAPELDTPLPKNTSVA
jgi:cell division septum initiation protein DivIVA